MHQKGHENSANLPKNNTISCKIHLTFMNADIFKCLF